MRRVVQWFVEHPTIVNLVMVACFVIGVVAIDRLPKESFPETALDIVNVEVKYPGAGPAEIEKGVLLKIEEKLQGTPGISEIRAEARENIGTLSIEVGRGKKLNEMLREIKDKVEQIQTFPKDAEKARIYTVTRKRSVMDFVLQGELPRSELQTLAEKVKDAFLNHPSIQQVDIAGKKAREISIEIREENLRKYQMQISDVARALRASNLDVSGGTLKTRREDVRVRMYNKRYTAKELENIVVRTLPGGLALRIKDVATARESFADNPVSVAINGKAAILIKVQSVAGDNILTIAKQAKEVCASLQARLPAKTKLFLYKDNTTALKSRISLLTKNGFQGLLLVLLVLSFFMNLRLAFWVAMGLLLSMICSFPLALGGGLTINMISLFGLMLVIGILVDDAIVIAENVYAHIERGASPTQAAIDGTMEVLPAVITAVTTTCLTFLPLFFMGGFIGKFIYMIPAMVIAALLCSLIESIVILPPHLAHSLKARSNVEYRQNRVRRLIERLMAWSREKVYARLLRVTLYFRWPTLALALSLLILSVGLIGGGVVKFVFFPQIEADSIVMRYTMKPGTPLRATKKVAKRVESMAREVDAEFKKKSGQSTIVTMVRWLGRSSAISAGFASATGEEVGEVQIELLPGEKRSVTSSQWIQAWRKKVGHVPGALQVSFASMGAAPVGKPLEFQLQGEDAKKLRRAVNSLKAKLATFEGVSNPEDDLVQSKRELRMKRTELAKSLDIPMETIAMQVKYRLYGQEVMRLQRGRDDLRVFVRYPESGRNSVERLNSLWIRTQKGKQLPLNQLVTWESARSLKVIRRINRQRIAIVSAQLDENVGNQAEIVRAIRRDWLPELTQRVPGVKFVVGGQGKEQAKVIGGMAVAFPLAMFGIFFILMLTFNSYRQVLLVMSMIPFGVVGAIVGHWVVGIPFTILSFFGVVGVSGVVVNDSIVLMDAINRHIRQGHPVFEAVWLAGQSRFRAILSTTLTTFFGLIPLLAERSLQAQFLIPMALSLAAGVLFATFLTLLFLPSLYLVVNDVKRVFHWLRRGEWVSADAIETRDAHGTKVTPTTKASSKTSDSSASELALASS